MSKFEFDFDAIKGKTYEDGFKTLFQQLEDHYNAEVNVKPDFVFGGLPEPRNKTVQLPDGATAIQILPEVPQGDRKFVRMEPGWEMKDASELGLKEGTILSGVSSDKVEVFDYVKNYTEGDAIADGESAKYDLSAK